MGRPLERAAVAAAAETLVEEWQEGRLFLPIRDAVLKMGVGVGLLAWLWSRRLMRVWERVWSCIGEGGGRALGVVWGSASISESESPLSPQPERCLSHTPTAQSGPGGLVWVTTLVALSFQGQRDPPR